MKLIKRKDGSIKQTELAVTSEDPATCVFKDSEGNPYIGLWVEGTWYRLCLSPDEARRLGAALTIATNTAHSREDAACCGMCDRFIASWPYHVTDTVGCKPVTTSHYLCNDCKADLENRGYDVEGV